MEGDAPTQLPNWVQLVPKAAVLSGTVTDESGNPIPDAPIRLEQDGAEITKTTTFEPDT